MTRPTKVEVDCSTGAIQYVELSDSEIAEREASALEAQALTEQREAAIAAKAEAKASALAKLTALGLTEDEAKAIVG